MTNKANRKDIKPFRRIEMLKETLLPLSKVSDWLAERGSRRFHESAIYRWSLYGLEGIKLPTINIGDARHTSEEALSEFFQLVTEKREGQR